MNRGSGCRVVLGVPHDLARTYSATLQDLSVLVVSTDGRDLLRQLRAWQPQVLIVDLALPGVDTLGLLERLQLLPTGAPQTLVLLSAGDEELIPALAEVGVTYFMVKPVDPLLLRQRVLNLASLPPSLAGIQGQAGQPESLPALIEELLDHVGAERRHLGRRYLQAAVSMAVEAGGLPPMTKEVYPGLALRYRVTAGAVERAIRNAISSAWRNPTPYFRELFAPSLTGGRPPSNSEFIATLAFAIADQHGFRGQREAL